MKTPSDEQSHGLGIQQNHGLEKIVKLRLFQFRKDQYYGWEFPLGGIFGNLPGSPARVIPLIHAVEGFRAVVDFRDFDPRRVG